MLLLYLSSRSDVPLWNLRFLMALKRKEELLRKRSLILVFLVFSLENKAKQSDKDDKATNSNGEDGLEADYVLTGEGGDLGGDAVIGSGKVQRK